IRLYGITKDPKTSNYVVVMDYMELGSLRANLATKKNNPNDKYSNLYYISKSLLALHECDLVHKDLHSGNILLQSHVLAYISDFGLSQSTVEGSNIEPNEIHGILPYIAPEVLRGEPYTKAADIYSFGILMWEMTSGIPAFNDVSHDFHLSLNICKGMRPCIIKDTEVEYVELMKRCWDPDPDKRPTAEELIEH
ncbi:kinase-like domain-containing protein, partial [Glomus cerebriforme]